MTHTSTLKALNCKMSASSAPLWPERGVTLSSSLRSLEPEVWVLVERNYDQQWYFLFPLNLPTYTKKQLLDGGKQLMTPNFSKFPQQGKRSAGEARGILLWANNLTRKNKFLPGNRGIKAISH